MIETNLRSWAKSLSWRIIGVVILFTIAWMFTKDLKEITGITLVFHSIRFVLFYFHERFWNKIKWGVTDGKSDMDDWIKRFRKNDPC